MSLRISLLAIRNRVLKGFLMLARFDHSTLINTASIQRIEAASLDERTGRPRCRIGFIDGSSLLVDCSLEQAERFGGQVVPAPAGYSVIEAFPPDKGRTELYFHTYPVIAFRLMADKHPESSTMPITPAGEPDGGWALIYPDGRCDAPWDRTHDSVEAFKTEYRKGMEMQQ